MTERHAAVNSHLVWFSNTDVPEYFKEVAEACDALAHKMVAELPDSTEMFLGLRKLLEAKDCFVRAAVLKAFTP